jgi:hypothetical protein
MANHPNRGRGPYTAEIGGGSWAQGPVQQFATIREARAWAEEYGSTADRCTITDAKGRKVGEHRRDGSSGRWFRAAI